MNSSKELVDNIFSGDITPILKNLEDNGINSLDASKKALYESVDEFFNGDAKVKESVRNVFFKKLEAHYRRKEQGITLSLEPLKMQYSDDGWDCQVDTMQTTKVFDMTPAITELKVWGDMGFKDVDTDSPRFRATGFYFGNSKYGYGPFSLFKRDTRVLVEEEDFEVFYYTSGEHFCGFAIRPNLLQHIS